MEELIIQSLCGPCFYLLYIFVDLKNVHIMEESPNHNHTSIPKSFIDFLKHIKMSENQKHCQGLTYFYGKAPIHL